MNLKENYGILLWQADKIHNFLTKGKQFYKRSYFQQIFQKLPFIQEKLSSRRNFMYKVRGYKGKIFVKNIW